MILLRKLQGGVLSWYSAMLQDPAEYQRLRLLQMPFWEAFELFAY